MNPRLVAALAVVAMLLVFTFAVSALVVVNNTDRVRACAAQGLAYSADDGCHR